MINHYITYHSSNAPSNEQWCAYLTKFKVFVFGSTEQEAKDKALAFYSSERSRIVDTSSDDLSEGLEIKKDGRGTANLGKVWMRHPEQGLKRVPMTEISMYEGNGYVRSGPRSK